MNSELKKNKKARIINEDREEEDLMNKLPDELLHRILKFIDTKLGVQIGTLSKR